MEHSLSGPFANSLRSICAIGIARLVLFDSVDLANPEFTYLSGTLYLFTSMEPLLAITLGSMPLLTPVGNFVRKSAALSWIKTIATSIGGISKGTSDGNSKISSDELPLHTNGAIYPRMDHVQSIRVDVELGHTYEMGKVQSRLT
jgi:hypothetical protein